MKTLKSIGNYFLNILTVLALGFLALVVAIFFPKHLSEIVTDSAKEVKKIRKKKK